MKIDIENFNAFTLLGILEKLNDFILYNHIKREDIICLNRCRDGSIDLVYWNK